MKVLSAQIHPYRLSLRSPITTSHGLLTERRGFLVELLDDVGKVGWGDACPIDGFGLEGLSACQNALSAGCAALVRGQEPDFSGLVGGHRPSARGALEVAFTDLSMRRQEQGFAQAFGLPVLDPPVDRLPVSGLVVGRDRREIQASAQGLMDRGHRSLKLKVADRSWSEDRIRIQELVDGLRVGVQIRLDANGGWTEDEAIQALGDLAGCPLELIEQPVAAGEVESMARLRSIASCPIAADESVVRPADLERVIDCGAADIVILKPSALGGPSTAFDMASRAAQAGLTVIVTSLLDSAIGVAAASHLAALLPRHRPADGLATGSIFEQDLAPSIPLIDGQLSVPAGVGLGLQPDPDALEALRTGPILEFSP